MKDYEKQFEKKQLFDYHLNEFINNGAFESFLMQGLRSVNFIEPEDIDSFFGLISFYTSSYDSIAGSYNGESVYLSFKYREMKYLINKEYDMIEDLDQRFDAFAAKLANLYFQTKTNEEEHNTEYFDNDDDDDNDEFDI